MGNTAKVSGTLAKKAKTGTELPWFQEPCTTGAEIELLDDRDPGVRYPRGVKSSAFAAIARAISDASTFKWSANLAKCSRFCASGASTLIIKNSAASARGLSKLSCMFVMARPSPEGQRPSASYMRPKKPEK
ncbi:MAG: hypothetical protein WBF62_06220 [Bradyrhizobium sp.]